MDRENVREAVRNVVEEMTGRNIRDGDPLISSGLIDSLAILKLIGRVETKLSVTIPLDDLQPEDFDTIDCATDTVLRAGRER